VKKCVCRSVKKSFSRLQWSRRYPRWRAPQLESCSPFDGNQAAAYPKAIAELKAAERLPEQVELRQVKYLNYLIEQDHRFIKRLVKPGLGFFSVETVGRTLQGYEVMNMIRKEQIRGVSKGDSSGQVAFIASLFGVAA
jgi:IS6 family transposase